jgi:hypothetical protein
MDISIFPGSSHNYSTFYTNAINVTKEFGAGAGVLNITSFLFNDPTGYYIGGPNATLYWNIVNNLTGVDLHAYVQLFNPKTGEIFRTLESGRDFNLSSPITVNTVGYTGHLNLTPFIRAHINLGARLVVLGYDTITRTQLYTRAEITNNTFVDATNTSRRTTVTIVNATELKVGALGNIYFHVLSHNNTNVTSGLVEVIWDGKYNLGTFNVTNGRANLEHLYKLAGANRTIEARFVGNDIGNGASDWAKLNVPVRKGTPTVDVVVPNVAYVGETTPILTNIFGIVVDSNEAPKQVRLEFRSAGRLVHTEVVNITAGTEPNRGLALLDYTFKQNHTALTITAVIAGNNNYENATRVSNPILVTTR